MGIKLLNRFLQQKCPEAIIPVTLQELTGQCIAIDTSIYLYKFIAENALLENLYLMISLFRKYNIKPFFVFDGKPPDEKKEVIQKRKQVKINAERTYNTLKKSLDTINDIEEKEEVKQTMENLKRKFIRIKEKDIEKAKGLMQAYGVTYFVAPGEADVLCAKLVVKKKVYACLSEDTDMFVYGCSKVLRYLSLVNESVVLYDLTQMLVLLGLTMKEFREICVVSGTDYNSINVATLENNQIVKNKETTLAQTLKYFKIYKKSNSNEEYYNWLEKNTKYVDDLVKLHYVYDMFDLTNVKYLKDYEKIKIMNGPINRERLIEVMKEEDFIFLPKGSFDNDY